MKLNLTTCGSRATIRSLLLLGVFVAAGSVYADAHWQAGWKKIAENPVLSLSDAGGFDSHNIFAPAITKHEGTYYLYYAGGPSGPLTNEEYINYQLGLATSQDGVHFSKRSGPLLPLGGRDNSHCAPALLRNAAGDLLVDDDGAWHMVFNGNRADDVEHATSTDGVQWKKGPRGPIYQTAYSPSLLKVEDQYWLYYIHKPDGQPWEVHLARGDDLYSLQAVGTNPVLKNSQDWESNNLFYPYVFQEGDTWVMLYAGYWNDPADGPTKTAIGAATSTDGLNWVKNPNNPIFKPTAGSRYDSVYTSSQSTLRDGDIYRLQSSEGGQPTRAATRRLEL